MVKNLPSMPETWVRSLGQEDKPWKREWQPTPVFLPGEFHGQRSLVGCSPRGSQRVGHDWATNTQFLFVHTFFYLLIYSLKNYRAPTVVQASARYRRFKRQNPGHLELLCCGGNTTHHIRQTLRELCWGECCTEVWAWLVFVCLSPLCLCNISSHSVHVHINFSSLRTRNLSGQASLEEVFFNYVKYFKTTFEDLLFLVDIKAVTQSETYTAVFPLR